jgi:4-hydroxybenzoate polyprenyltransferase
MVHQADRLFNSGTSSFSLIAFVFFSTICSYSFHWYLTDRRARPSPRINWLNRFRFIHVVLFFLGIAGAGYYFFLLIDYWPWLVIAAAGAFLYSAPKIPHPIFRALRKVAVGKTIFLSFVWMYVTTVLPVVIAGHEWTVPVILFFIYRFFMVYAICILFDYRDREDDRAAGIRSLVTFMKEKNITILFICSLVIAVAAAAGMLYTGFTPLHFLFLAIPCIITGLLYEYARKNFPDMFYYFTLDGLMALSALLMLVASI